MNFNQDESLIELRIPPQSIEAESSVLGALLLDNHAFDQVSDLLTENSFYSSRHSLIFKSIKTLITSCQPADVITVHSDLENSGRADEIGGLGYLNSLAQYVPSAANIRRYALHVRDRSVRRALIASADNISAAAYAPNELTNEDLLSQAEYQLSHISSGIATEGIKSLDTLAVKFMDKLQDKVDNPGLKTGVLTGYYGLDDCTGGLQAGDLIVVAGRPSMGKTALAMNIAEDASIEQDLPVLVISLEMNAESLTQRIIGSIGRIDQTKLRDGTLNEQEWPLVVSAVESLKGKILDVLDVGGSTVGDIRSVARQAVKRHKKLGLIVVDYIQLMGGETSANYENRTNEITQITRGLKLLAKEMQCPVIALSQLNRKVEERADKRPLMSDLRESGSIEQDADIILFVYRDDYYTKDASKCPGIAEIIVAKQRNGATGTVQLGWSPQYTRFNNL